MLAKGQRFLNTFTPVSFIIPEQKKCNDLEWSVNAIHPTYHHLSGLGVNKDLSGNHLYFF